MYHHIAGTLETKSLTDCVVDANGVGYFLKIPYHTATSLPNAGQKVKLLTYLHVTEDAHTLYGFATEPERQFFLQLMTVDGVGPKLAMTVLSGGRVQDIQQAIRLGDYSSLRRIKGVGETTAKKIVLQLGKILIHQPATEAAKAAKAENAIAAKSGNAVPAAPGLDEQTDIAVKAVMQLQEVSSDMALAAVQRAWSELSAKSKEPPVIQDVIQRAMRYTG